MCATANEIKAAKEAAIQAAKDAAQEATAQVLASDGADGAEAAAGSGECTDKWGRPCLKVHKRKTAAVFQAFDLTVDVPKCLDCGVEPCKKGTSSNCYSHFYHHHRPRWLQYKKEDGALSDAGDAALQTIKEQLAAAAAASAASLTTKTLQGDAKTAMDRVTSEWIVDDDMAKGAASTPAYKKKMKIATQGVLLQYCKPCSNPAIPCRGI